MSKVDNKDLFQTLIEIRQLLFRIIDTKYVSAKKKQGSIGEAQREEFKKEAKITVEDLCSSIIYKIELLASKLLTIKSFDWDKFHNFQSCRDPKDDNRVCQQLHGGAFVVSCKDKETMEHFIFTEITTFISNIGGVIDNVALLIERAFILDIKGIVLLDKIYDQLSDGPLRDFLKKYTKEKYNFWGMRYIRTACEHQDLTKVFQYGEKAGLGKRDLKIPYINDDIRKLDTPEENRIDLYCEFLHEKTCDFIQEFAIALSKSSS